MTDKYDVEFAETLANETQGLPIAEATSIYEQLLQLFRTVAKFWKQYVEAHMAVNNDDAIKQIFSCCLLNCLQVPLCPKRGLFYCVIYLKPGDYHWIHSPADWNILVRRHFSGNLYLVNERATRTFRNLYIENERPSWEIFTPLLHKIDGGELKPIPYKPGSRGPAEADELLEKAGYVQTHGYIWIPPTSSYLIESSNVISLSVCNKFEIFP